MRLDKIDLNLFVIFDAIYRERNITRVARLLSVSQPAVSNALARLRDTFDDPLFVRSSEGMIPTPAADSVIDDVRLAMSLLRQSVDLNARFDPANSDRVLRVGMNDLAEALVLPGLHERVSAVAPKVALTSYYVARDDAAEELKDGLLDILLDIAIPASKELRSTPLSEFPYVLAMRHGHPLAGTTPSLDSYLEAQHLHVSSRREGLGHVDIALRKKGLTRSIAMRVQSYLVAARIVRETDLLWAVPGVLARQLDLHVAPLPLEVAALEWHLYWSRSAQDDPSNIWLRGIITELVATEIGTPV
jgi:DNA-binding transcriptional LysR family regulator